MNVNIAKMFDWIRGNPVTTCVIGSAISIVVAHKLYWKYRYSLSQFDRSHTNLNNVAILITGVSSGIGYNTAIKLVELGYCVIGTSTKVASIEKLNNDPKFSRNGSFVIQMDVSNIESIKKAKMKVLNWLEHNPNHTLTSEKYNANMYHNRILWGIVNNAGTSYLNEFESLPYEFMMYEYNVLLFGPINVCREFLPLIYGRRVVNHNNNINQNDELSLRIRTTMATRKKIGKNELNRANFAGNLNNSNIFTNGGRIINITTIGRFSYGLDQTRYAVSKVALAKLTECLRVEYASTFGIWSSEIAPGPYITKFKNNAFNNLEKVEKYYCNDDGDKSIKTNELSEQDLEIANIFQVEKYCTYYQKWINNLEGKVFNNDLTPCVDDIVHAITSQYPKRLYTPGFSLLWKILFGLPYAVIDSLQWQEIDKKLIHYQSQAK